jgi:hypothetical protein
MQSNAVRQLYTSKFNRNIECWQKPLNSINFSRLFDDAAETDDDEDAEKATSRYTDDEKNLISNIMNPSTLSKYTHHVTMYLAASRLSHQKKSEQCIEILIQKQLNLPRVSIR